MTARPLLLAALLCISQTLMAETQVIDLNFRTAGEILPVIQSTLGSEGKVTPYGNKLIINSSTEKIAEVRSLLEQLDTKPRRLLISVDTSDSNVQSNRGYSTNGTISAGNGEVVVGRGEINGRDQVRIINRSTNSRGGGVQQVQTNEGYPALIQVGQSVPLTSTGTGPYGQVYSNTEYRNVTRGFYVTASLTGDQVHISLSSNRDRVSQSRPDVIDLQNTDTRVSGPVGQWITVGGVNEQNQSQDSDFLQRRSTQGREDMTLRVKVDVVD
ncbi:secretin N-terminal domain-containing protein [Pseudomonas segetis]|uniref:Type II and III secretion system protein n=1 Tax=Pseudomonas segetis TaxID=298908 RepID=A0A239AJ22_9PSED|nr:secretin N-terminal domain-containing protein [Pseudomonas segetis]SNR95342.1 type II and III secretion system protein [Pseudomonas segetis]